MQQYRKNLRVTWLLQRELSGSETVLDVGCGPSSLLQYIKGPTKTIGVEYWKPYIEESRQRGIHNEYINADITEITYPDASFDSVILIDVLEHFGKDDAIGLLQKIKQWTKKNVIIVVPNGFVSQDGENREGNKKQHHLSCWTVKELETLGFHVSGLGGIRYLRGEGAQIIPTRTRFGHYFLAGISRISEPVTEIIPKYSYHLFAVWKRKG